MKRSVHVRLGASAIPIGELIVEADGARETSAFTYDARWMGRNDAFALAPGMPLSATPVYTNRTVSGSPLPAAIADGTPDSWGRAVIKAVLGGRIRSELDYLVETHDFLRAGALRYYDSPEPDAPALAPPREGQGITSIPRLLDLGQVIAEARAFEADPIHYRERRAQMIGGDLLRNAVGTLGGARPKVNARAEDGSLWIVKLAKTDDAYAVARAEVMALRLARRVGIRASTADVLPSGHKFPVAIVKRFDRGDKGARIPFISAQTFMDLPGAEPGNYVDVAFRMRQWSLDLKGDLRELYRRMLYNMLIQNTDDHLRNLGFLYRGQGKWGLSPAYDINPVAIEGTTLKTAISDSHGTALDIDAAVEVSEFFEIDHDDARTMAATMAATIRDEWREIGARLDMTASDVRAIQPAMENRQIDHAIALGQPVFPGAALR